MPCLLTDLRSCPLPVSPAAEIAINLSNLRPDIRAEWDELKQHDVLFLLTIRPPDSITRSYMAQAKVRAGLAAQKSWAVPSCSCCGMELAAALSGHSPCPCTAATWTLHHNQWSCVSLRRQRARRARTLPG